MNGCTYARANRWCIQIVCRFQCYLMFKNSWSFPVNEEYIAIDLMPQLMAEFYHLQIKYFILYFTEKESN